MSLSGHPRFDEKGRPRRPGHGIRNALTIVVLLLIAGSALGLNVDPARLARFPEEFATIVSRMFSPPDLAYAPRALDAMLESVQMAWIGTIIGAIFSLPAAFLAARNVSPRPVVVVTRQILNAIRAIPELLWAVVIMMPIFGFGPLPGAMALGINSIGTLGKLTSEAIEGIDPGPVEAARAAGASQWQILRWGVLPQVLPEAVAFWLYRFEINIRASAILGVLGAGGIGTLLINLFNFRFWPQIGMTMIVIVAVTMVIDFGSAALRKRIIAGAPTTTPAPGTAVELPAPS
jgi:phosphonate transport system permease protein